MINTSEQLSPRESILMDAEREENRLTRAHAVELKKLELELLREEKQAEIELKRLQAKWASWLQIPIFIIKLPLFILFGIAYICSMFTKKEMPKRFWDIIS